MVTKKILLLGLVLALALGLRLYRLGDENFWGDEIAYVQDASQEPIQIIDFTGAPRTRVHHVTAFPHLLLHFIISSARPSESAARIPSALFGSLEVAAIFIFASRLFSFHVGLLAALLLAVSPLHLWYSQEARWYAQWSFIATCSYVALLYAWKQNRPSNWIIYGLTTLLNIYSFVYAGLVLALQTISTLMNRFGRKRSEIFGRCVLTHVCVSVAALPILWMILRGLEKSSGTPRSLGWADLPYTFFAYAAGFTAGPTVAELHGFPHLLDILLGQQIVLIYLTVFAPMVLLGARETIRDSTASALLLPWGFGLPILVFFIASVSNVAYQVRYTLPALPAFFVILALGVLSLRSKPLKFAWTVGIVSCSLFSISNFYWEPRYDREHVRAAIARVQAATSAGAPIVSIGQINRAVRYYGKGLNVVAVNKERCTDSTRILEQESLQASRKVWVVAARDWKERTSDCLKKLSQSHSIVEQQSFPGTTLWLLELRQ